MLKVINMIPSEMSSEMLPDCVPDVQIDPLNPRRLLARTGRPDAPFLVSRDGGDTWSRGSARAAGGWPSPESMAWQVPPDARELARRAGITPLGDDLIAAADPRDPTLIFLAWVELAGERYPRLCLRRSTDAGETWSPDLRIVRHASGAALAVNQRGEVALVYRQLTGLPPDQRWVVYLEHSTNAFATVTQRVLADTPADPADLAELDAPSSRSRVVALVEAFCGAFVADNTPNPAHFPSGVVFQRHADFAALRLLDGAGGGTVLNSRDPFYFYLAAAV